MTCHAWALLRSRWADLSSYNETPCMARAHHVRLVIPRRVKYRITNYYTPRHLRTAEDTRSKRLYRIFAHKSLEQLIFGRQRLRERFGIYACAQLFSG